MQYEKEQKFIAEVDFERYKLVLKSSIEQGWRVVPGTVQFALTSGSVSDASGTYTIERYFCVVEK